METKNKKFGLREIVLGASLTLGTLGLPGCNPIDAYRTIQIRCEEPELYKMYKQINMNNLTDAEKQYLKEMHQKYGEEPIDTSKISNELSEDMVKNFSDITGHKKFTDKDLIFINRSLPGIVGGIMINIDGQR